MTKSELRKARKQAKAEGKPLTGELHLNDNQRDTMKFSETARGYKARERSANWFTDNGDHDYSMNG